jgi:hypothetical protein
MSAAPLPAASVPDEVRRIVLDGSWEMFLEHAGANDSHLYDYAEDYEDETGAAPRIPRGRRMERGAELLDPRFAAWCRERVDTEAGDLATALASRFEDGSIRCWRALVAPEGWRPEGANCGVHWSYDQAQAVAHFGDGDPGETFVVESLVPFASIDWERTLRANFSEEFREEREITISEDAPVTVVGVEQKAPPSPAPVF